MGRTVSIRRSLILNIIIVFALLGGAIMLTMVISSIMAITDLSAKVTRQTIAQTEAKLSSFFSPVENELLRVHTLGRKGLINLDDFEHLRDQLKAVMRHYPQVTSLMVADDTGKSFMMLRTNGDQWMIRQMGGDPQGKRAKITRWSDDPDQPVTETWQELDYDARDRPWYKGAVAKWDASVDPSGRENAAWLLHWTDPYQFFTTKEYGITVSARFQQPDGTRCVVGFDILLKDLQMFTDNLKVLSHGQAVILSTEADRSEEVQIIGFSASEHFGRTVPMEEFMLKSPRELEDPLIRDAFNKIRKRAKVTEEQVSDPVNISEVREDIQNALKGANRFRSSWKYWWVSGEPFTLANDQQVWMVVVVPESDMLGDVQHSLFWVLGITVGVFVLAILRAKSLANRYSTPIELLVESSNRMSTGDLEPGEPIVSSVREVHQLADAHETMRRGLKTLMKLEGDIAIAREIQQKTLPQSIPHLAGFDIDGWNAPADETGGDTYDIVGFEVDDATGNIDVGVEAAGQVILLLADATGHGLGPALSVTQLRAMLRMAVRIKPDIAVIAEHINEQLCADLPEGRFITAWLGQIDAADHSLQYFAPGQAPLLHYRAAENTVKVLDADTFPLGIFEPLGSNDIKQLTMNPGDIFAVISDGIYEAVDPDEEQFGTDRVIDIIKQNKDASAKAVSEAVRNATDHYTQNAPPDDDRTIIIIKRIP